MNRLSHAISVVLLGAGALGAPARAQSLSTGVLIADLNPGSSGSTPSSFFWVGNRVVFTAGTSGGALWTTDGTRAGTVRVPASDGSPVTGFNSPLFNNGAFVIFNGATGVWRSDGTRAGTFRLTPASMYSVYLNSPGYHPAVATADDGITYFPAQATGDPDGLQLYRTDGTVAGTYKVTTIAGGFHLTSILAPVTIGTRVVFNDQNSPPKQYVTDGTLAGTHFYYQGPSAPWLHVATKFPGATGGPLAVYDRVSFLERTDGTAAGTFPIAALWDATPHTKVAAADRLYFSPSSQPPRLMISDGTLPGTNDIAPVEMLDGAAIGGRRAVLAARFTTPSGSSSSSAYLHSVDDVGTVQQLGSLFVFTGFRGTSFITEGGVAYFLGSGTINGVSRSGFYRTDGTSAGTVCVSAAYNLYGTGSPTQAIPFMIKIGNRILYAGTDTTVGTELYGADVRPTVDCNTNGMNDYDEIALGAAFDANHNGVLDSCECLADWSGGGLSAQDVFDFIGDWFGAGADFNHSGATNVQDIFDFLNAWLAGC